MTEEQLVVELAEIEKDENLTPTEKKISLSIYGAELEKIKSDKYIVTQKREIQNLREKIINNIINIYSSLDEEKKEKADGMLYDLGLAASTIDKFKIDDVLSEHELDSDSVDGTIAFYLDNNIHEELEKLNIMYENFIRSIDRKYIKLEDKLSDILDPEVFNFMSHEDSEKYKERKEFDDMFVKENEKIDKLDIATKEKGILRNILFEAIKYGKSHETMYTKFDDMTDYINQKKSELSDGMHM